MSKKPLVWPTQCGPLVRPVVQDHGTPVRMIYKTTHHAKVIDGKIQDADGERHSHPNHWVSKVAKKDSPRTLGSLNAWLYVQFQTPEENWVLAEELREKERQRDREFWDSLPKIDKEEVGGP